MPLSDTERKAISNRLRTAAQRVLGVVDAVKVDIEKKRTSKRAITRASKLSKWMGQMCDAWREFPECRDDKSVPPPHKVIEIVNRMDREAKCRYGVR